MKISIARTVLSFLLLPPVTVACGGGKIAAAPSTPPPTSTPPPAPTPPPPPTPTPPPPTPPPPPSVPPIPTSWQATDLPPLPGMSAAQANAVNNKGAAVGYSVLNGVAEATLWENGQTIDLGSTGSANVANGINDAGQVVGYYLTSTGPAHAFTWPARIDLGTLPGFDSSVASGINTSGVIVGVSFDSTNMNHQAAFRWTLSGGMVPVAGCASAEAVNDAGQISGIATNLNATICGMPDFGKSGAAVAINSLGQTAGYSGADAWLFPTTDLGPTLATGINDNGWVVGYSVTPLGPKARLAVDTVSSHVARLSPRIVGTSQPWIWSQKSGIVLLPSLFSANAMNKISQIVGATIAADGSTHGVLLTGN